MQYTAFFPFVLATVASAHIQIQYPPPRGPFIASQEPSFCDGFTSATSNRTLFPLNDGVINFKTSHPEWTIGFIVSTNPDATSFSDFNTSSGYQMAVPFVKHTGGGGQFCLPISLATSGVSGIQEGANVTIQAVFDGGDGSLYQCADLTLSANASIPGNVTSNCTDPSATGTASAPSATHTGDVGKQNIVVSGPVTALLLGLVASYF
ncbi:hypothetical protein V8B97DRAFT_895431 [Scleroderma yunnanense]